MIGRDPKEWLYHNGIKIGDGKNRLIEAFVSSIAKWKRIKKAAENIYDCEDAKNIKQEDLDEIDGISFRCGLCWFFSSSGFYNRYAWSDDCEYCPLMVNRVKCFCKDPYKSIYNITENFYPEDIPDKDLEKIMEYADNLTEYLENFTKTIETEVPE